MPLGFEMTRAMFKDQERIVKPIIDDYEAEEFDRRICYAMEYNLKAKFSVWDEGFTADIIGHIHYIDPIKHQLRIEVKPGEFHGIKLEDVIALVVID
ncbi:YolD-like family protein [Bacillus sp. ISL-40]|uniref:YolD-like family protein n=1 Tax=Bacillus sp. ISL-40 TaxID=2819126 RepID=UPI001BE9C958|nr:YolD-like family protein [Bacillus sp. ISL-40]MBT2696662.1 YolD-like family protein [Bacillus sp. ISL-40]